VESYWCGMAFFPMTGGGERISGRRSERVKKKRSGELYHCLPLVIRPGYGNKKTPCIYSKKQGLGILPWAGRGIQVGLSPFGFFWGGGKHMAVSVARLPLVRSEGKQWIGMV